MSALAPTRGAASKTLAVVLLAGILMLAAESSQAARYGGRGSPRGGRTLAGDSRGYRGDGRAYGGSLDIGGRGRNCDLGDRAYAGGRRAHAPGVPAYISGGRAYVCPGGRYYERGSRYHGSARYYGPYGYGSMQPRRVIRFGLGSSVPYQSPPAYRYHVERYPVEAELGPSMITPSPPPPVEMEPGPSVSTPDQSPPVETEPGPSASAPDQSSPVETESGTQFDVTNDPPAGCHYYDRFCGRRFSNLDVYTVHVESQDHPKTLEILRNGSADRLRTLEFVGGYWSVQQ